jgi:NAD(P)-dependent dehydrogenase (short-subunit alcohol dehydrogenase family)
VTVSSQKCIFITGGASGIGRAVAQHFAGKGWFVGLADVDDTGLAETSRLLPEGKSSTHHLDVRDRDEWRAALTAFVVLTGGRIDVLFNNAGVARGGAFELVEEADHDLLVDVNFKGVMYGAEIGLPYLKATPGSCLLNTASAAALYGGPGLATYSATKFAVRGLTEALDIEWEPYGVKVRSLMPGFIDTPLLDIMTAGTNHSAREGVREAGLEFTPVERVAEAAWNAVHGTKLHHPVGPTAKRAALFARLAPSLLRKRFSQRPGNVI